MPDLDARSGRAGFADKRHARRSADQEGFAQRRVPADLAQTGQFGNECRERYLALKACQRRPEAEMRSEP